MSVTTTSQPVVCSLLLPFDGCAAAACHGVRQMDQKHAVEDVLLGSDVPGLMLEATMFMEEFWKKYTRPGLLKGTFTFSLPGLWPVSAGGPGRLARGGDPGGQPSLGGPEQCMWLNCRWCSGVWLLSGWLSVWLVQ